MNETKSRDEFAMPEYESYEIDLRSETDGTAVYHDAYLPYNGLDEELAVHPIEAQTKSSKKAMQNFQSRKKSGSFKFDPDFNLIVEAVIDFIEQTGDITINTVSHYIAFCFDPLQKKAQKKREALKLIEKQRKKKAKEFIESLKFQKLTPKNIFNMVFPFAAIVILLVTLNHIQNTTFALDVIYNNKHIGYIESEETFEQAKTLASKMLPSHSDNNESSSLILSSEPTYKISRVNFNELSNKSMICENIIQSCDIALVRACGIYIDGEFLCAVKNESDAVSVFSNFIAPSKAKADKDTIVAFVEEIEYIQGLYPDTEETVWDSLKLKKTLNEPKSEAEYYTIVSGDNASSIASKNNLTVKQLKALNPETNFLKLKAGRQLLVAPQTEYVRIKVMKTRSKTQRLPFETVKKESSYYSKGTTKVAQEGSYGEKVTTELVTYINGVETYSTVVSVKQTKAPVNKIIYIGTKESYSGYSTSTESYTPSYSSGFIWPTRGAYSLSSTFGYRSAWISGWSFHGGVDIVKSGGPSTGVPVIAAASGTVVVAQSGYSGYGHTVLIDHGNGFQTRYAHMYPGSITVYAGQYVYQGQQIGQIGATGNVTGPHLHFEVLRYGTKVNPLNYIG